MSSDGPVSLETPGPAESAPPARRPPNTLILAMSGVVAAGIVAGLFVWQPWKPSLEAPAVLDAQSPTATSVDLTWSAPHGGATPDHYLVLRDGKQVGTVSAGTTSYHDHGLALGTTYRYTVESGAGGQVSGPSVPATVMTLAPSPVSATATPKSYTTVLLRWKPSPLGPAPDHYVIYNVGNVVATVPGTDHSYLDTRLSAGEAYGYRVVARWGSKQSAPSGYIDGVTPPAPLSGWAPVQVTTTSAPGGGAVPSAGAHWSGLWQFTPACVVRVCRETAGVVFQDAPGQGTSAPSFPVTLTSFGGGYSGSAKARATFCGSVAVADTITLRLVPDKGAVTRSGGWSSWTGTMVLTEPYVRVPGTSNYCPQQSWNFSLAG